MNMNDPIATLLGNWATSSTSTLSCSGLPYPLYSPPSSAVSAQASVTPPGQRTFILVSLASTMAMMLDKSFSPSNPQIISAAAVIAIAIISSNSILYSSKNQIKGLTILRRALGLQHHRLDHRRGAVYRVRHRLRRADVLSGLVPDV